VAGAFILSGIFLLVRRFSLRWLLLGVISLAALGAYPFIRIPGNPQNTEFIHVSGPRPLYETGLTRVRNLMQPAAALSTLPARMVKDLKLNLASCIRSVSVSDDESYIGFDSQVEFAEDLDPSQRATLECFYRAYATEVIYGQVAGTTYVQADSKWPAYEQEWHALIKARKLVPPKDLADTQ